MERRNATEAEASALASGIRLRIIRLTGSEALTNKELAGRLGRDPATTLHHVRKLVETGFLEPQPPRRGRRGAKEIPYLSTGLSWRLLYQGAPRYREVAQAALEAYLGEISEIDVGELRQRRLVVSLGEEAREEFEQRVGELLDDFAARPAKPDGDSVAIYVATYPSR
ncbi:ArsR/SmtB family transcription factor [Amycolatopsis pigmentata]|uniref:ArsR/SmtB family transcription factor n=1 Tax=Amycolatopsis pigmentata TaxID=450801 RepID=A0ABW5G1D4_9PSEU